MWMNESRYRCRLKSKIEFVNELSCSKRFSIKNRPGSPNFERNIFFFVQLFGCLDATDIKQSIFSGRAESNCISQQFDWNLPSKHRNSWQNEKSIFTALKILFRQLNKCFSMLIDENWARFTIFFCLNCFEKSSFK